MKSSIQVIIALFIAVMLESTYAVDFEWEPEADVEIPGNAVIHVQPGLRRAQATTDLSSTGSAATSSAAASAASATTETETPTTIMVLLPDNLAPSYSGSGSVMFFDGSVGDNKRTNKPAGSDSVGEVSNSASGNIGVATALTAVTILLALTMA
ncbi:hypothetical protein PHMEG_00019064 [Phytophthora megakarya]|uniref:Uncharacterized protein n=1 Tax=Phytophthora megakarya TaxID=4795 RepID=A0A225VSU0_9STRA|nr:hypothetical protein PHMEG_00019064 [Phytophthora megakarya]